VDVVVAEESAQNLLPKVQDSASRIVASRPLLAHFSGEGCPRGIKLPAAAWLVRPCRAEDQARGGATGADKACIRQPRQAISEGRTGPIASVRGSRGHRGRAVEWKRYPLDRGGDQVCTAGSLA